MTPDGNKDVQDIGDEETGDIAIPEPPTPYSEGADYDDGNPRSSPIGPDELEETSSVLSAFSGEYEVGSSEGLQ